MKVDLKAAVQRVQPLMALAKCIAVLLSYVLGAYVIGRFHESSRLMGAMLACTSAVVVLTQEDMKNAVRKGWLRVVGTFVGAVIASLYLLGFPFTVFGMIVAVFLLEIICMFLAVPDNGKMATITLIAILIISRLSPDLPPLVNGLLRFSESTVGVSVGLFLAWLAGLATRKKRAVK